MLSNEVEARKDTGQEDEKKINIQCTSASSTTHLVFWLMESCQDDQNPYPDGEKGSCTGEKEVELFLSTHQDGAIISEKQANIHVRIALSDRLVSTPQFGSVKRNEDGLVFAVKVTINQQHSVTVPLTILITQGLFVSLLGMPGTHVLDLCLVTLEPSTDGRGDHCLTQCVLIFEVFSADKHMVQMRTPIRNWDILTSTAIGTTPSVSGFSPARVPTYGVTKVVFILDPTTIDGYKLSTLHLIKNLPISIKAAVLDLSCEEGSKDQMHFLSILKQEGILPSRLCIMLPSQAEEEATSLGMDLSRYLYALLHNAETWSHLSASYPEWILTGLGELEGFLRDFHTMVMSNGARDADAYLLELARLAGVRIRVVNLGALSGGYMSSLYSGATAFIAPSHYVAFNLGVLSQLQARQIEICHPVVDVMRIQQAASSCKGPPWEDRVSMDAFRGVETSGCVGWHAGCRTERRGEHHYYREGATSEEVVFGDDGATFIFVGRMSTEKTPGVFVRAMATLRHIRQQGVIVKMEDDKNIKVHRVSPARGVLVGDGPLREVMETLAADLKANVTFAGFVPIDSIPCAIKSATALVLPSFCPETFGIVAAEAMLLGVPVVTFGFGGSGELVRHMENGLVVDEPTPLALARALQRLIEDRSLHRRLAANARVDAETALVLDSLVKCHTSMFIPDFVESKITTSS